MVMTIMLMMVTVKMMIMMNDDDDDEDDDYNDNIDSQVAVAAVLPTMTKYVTVVVE